VIYITFPAANTQLFDLVIGNNISVISIA